MGTRDLDSAIIGSGSEALATASILREWADMVIENVGTQSDDRLVELARDAQDLEKAAFRVRGACGAELKRRILERRLTSDDSKSGDLSVGRQMNALAREI